MEAGIPQGYFHRNGSMESDVEPGTAGARVLDVHFRPAGPALYCVASTRVCLTHTFTVNSAGELSSHSAPEATSRRHVGAPRPHERTSSSLSQYVL
eukprot:533795-Prymnesium_polylepis.1